MSRPGPVLLLTLLAALLGSTACGGGGGGGDGDSSGIGGPGPVPPGSFGVTLGPIGGKIQGLNVPVSLQFSKALDGSTVNASTIKVVTVTDPGGVSTAPPGALASVTYSTNANVATIRPTVTFTPTEVEYGFVADALYEISFTPPVPGPSVKSSAGEAMSNPGSTFYFRTPDKGFDFQPGYPKVRAFVVDDPTDPGAPVVLPPTIVDAPGAGGGAPDGNLVPETIAFFGNPVELTLPTSPLDVGVGVRPILFVFSDAVIPSSVVNPVNAGSPSIRVQVNATKAPGLLPKTIPATHSMFHQQGNLTLVLWKPKFVVYPPGAFVFVNVLPTVQDLAFNTKQSITGSNDPDLTASLRVVGVNVTDFTLTETFENGAKEDVTATSADWAVVDMTSGKQVLAPVLGGGTGADGPLVIDPLGTAADPGDTIIPPGSLIDFTAKSLALPTVEAVVGGVLPRRYAFTSVQIPMGWTVRPLTDRDGDGSPDPAEFVVQSAGHPLDGLGAPLLIQSTGTIVIDGTIDVSGEDAGSVAVPGSTADAGYADYAGQGVAGAEPTLAAGGGGAGGDVLLLDQDDQIVFPLLSPSPEYEPSDGKLRGVTGLSSGLTATTLSDATQQFTLLSDPGDPVLSGLLAAGEIRLQPNVGVGSSLLGNSGTPNESIDENHPTFVVATVDDDATLGVAAGSGDMNQPSDNIGNGYAAIASAGDPYLVGRLHGRPGLDLTPFDRGGSGAEPYVVVNEGALGITTTGGGGGGGGAFTAGASGQSDGPDPDPLVDQRGTSGGIAKDESSGAPGGMGTVRGMVRVTGATTLDLVSQSDGRPLAGLAGAPLAGSRIIPDSFVSGWMFDVVAFDGTTFTVAPIEVDEVEIDLLDGPGPAGPGLGVGVDYAFVLVPSLEIGGAGGGGSGVSVTGTLNANPGVLPRLTPGAAGGGGGGSLVLETASTLRLSASGRILARGGAGGGILDVQAGFAGGGGGGGGNLVLRAGDGMTFLQGAMVAVLGGPGGGEATAGQGGAGGGGFIRLEDFHDALLPAAFFQTTSPPVSALNLGRMFGDPQGIGQSLFYTAMVLNPEWREVTVTYLADTDDDGITEEFEWSFAETGATSVPPGLLDPPFEILFNSVGFNDAGFLDSAAVDAVFLPVSDLVSGRTGLAWDATTGVLLHCVGRSVHRIHRLDPATLAPTFDGAQSIELPTIPSAASDVIDVVSLATGGPDAELFLLERSTSRVHVLDLATGQFRRTIVLPIQLDGAMTYLPPPLDLLLLADNRADRLVTFERLDPDTLSLTQDYAPLVPVSQFEISRDGVMQDLQLVGMAYDASSERLWCTDALANRVFQADLSAGNEGLSQTGSESFSTLLFDLDPGAAPEPVPIIPSAVAFDGTDLFLVHAVDPTDGRVRRLARTDVDAAGVGADTVLADFGTLLPEAPFSMDDGRIFLRFRIRLDGSKDAGATSFRKVRIDTIELTYDNEPF
jgi:hypothetical protein